MDTIGIIIFTAVINVIVTGIVSNIMFYRYQKNIENSFAKELKEFESDLQKSFFEYQTKTAISYPKKIETLENLYRKFWSYADKATSLNTTLFILQTEQRSLTREAYDVYAKDWKETWKLLQDFHSYFETNRVFLPQDIAMKIRKISKKAKDDCDNLSYLVTIKDEEARKKWLQQLDLSRMIFDLEMWTKDLEKIFKSSTEVINSEQQTS